jgi:hypothetical protein
MTDAAISVTQSAVELFTEQYLLSLGCDIERHEDEWDATIPGGVETALAPGEHTLRLGNDSAEGEDVELLHPESGLFQRLLSEAGERCPTGKMTVEAADTDVEIPAFLQNSDVRVKDARFTPYYDRTAVVFLFKVSIETVSEYQQELLRAIAVDTRSGELLPRLEDVFLQSTSLEGDSSTSDQSDLNPADVRPHLDTGRNQLIDRTQSLIDEIHEEASRAADAEVEEFRQMQQQRIEELEEKHSTLSSKIDELSEAIDSSGQEARVRALKERKEVKAEYDEIDAELTDLRERRDQGFPERQQEIRERHALDVRTTPLTVTQVEYERGEVELDLAEGDTVRTVTAGYGSGVGLTEEVRCSSCDRALSDEDPLRTIRGGLRCRDCTSASN